jgi:hypothetical protein
MKKHIFAAFPAKKEKTLTELCLDLLEQQKKNWPQLSHAHLALSEVRTRTVEIGAYQVSLQFNPRRILSSGAAVDKESIKSRSCFLCSSNLPPEQKGILYQRDYLILCNPAPVFDEHFTIVHVQHLPQTIAFSLSCFLDITYDLAPDYAVFYNGPACGASAPDHLHFQAVPMDSLPLAKFPNRHFRIVKKIDGINIYTGEKLDRAMLILEGKNKNVFSEQFNRLIKIINTVAPSTDEPMINVICHYSEPYWRLIIFLRAKHRPDAFYLEGEKRIFVSFGAIDMAGFIITPLLNDFDRLDAAQIQSMFREVSLGDGEANKLIDAL